MSEITKKIGYNELPDPKYRELFKYTDGSTVLGIINYENGDVYMGEIKLDEACEEKRDRRRHGYGKLLSKGAITESQWNTGITVGHTLKISKTGKRSFEIRGEDLKFRTVLYQYYLTEDNEYAGDKYNNACKSHFYRPTILKVCDREALRESLFNGTALPEAPKPAAKKEEKKAVEKPAPVKKSAPKKEEKPAPQKEEKKPAEKPAPKKEEKPEPKPVEQPNPKILADEAKERGDTETAIKLYFEAAKYADIEAVIAYLRLVTPALYASVDKERAEYTAEKLWAVEKKLDKIERNIFGKSTGKRTDGTGMRLVEEARCDDSPYANRLKASCCRDDEKKRHYLALAADGGDYLAIFEMLKYYEKDSTMSYDGRQLIVDGVFDPDKLWHYLFLQFVIGERRVRWFTSEKLEQAYPDIRKLGLFFRRFALNRVANTLSGLVERDVAPGRFDAQVPVPEEMKKQIFSWLFYLVDTYVPEQPRDFGRYTLAYMLDAGYGCEKNAEKARALVCDTIATEAGGSVYAKDDLPDWMPMAGPVAYIIANHNVEQGVFDKETKDLLTFAAKESAVESYRKPAQNRLDLFIEDDSECFSTALERYNAGDYEQAALLWRKLADKGNAMACRNVATIYLKHIPNEEMSDYYIEKGAALGEGLCIYNKAVNLREKGDYAEAYELYEKVTGMNIQTSINVRGKSFLAMAEMLYDGEIKKVNGKEQGIFYAHKAEQTGIELERSFSDAGIKWMMAYNARTVSEEFRSFALEKALEQGSPYAHLEMGIRYVRGDGVEQDPELAEKHLRKAPDGTRREYYMMCKRIIEAERMLHSDTDDARDLAFSHFAQTTNDIWARISTRSDYSDTEGMGDLCKVLYTIWEVGDGDDAIGMAKLMGAEECGKRFYYRYRYALSFTLLSSVMSQLIGLSLDSDVSDQYMVGDIRGWVMLIKDALEHNIPGAKEKADEILSPDMAATTLAYCKCSVDDAQGVALQRFVAEYFPNTPRGNYVAAAVYMGNFLNEENVILDHDKAAYYLHRLTIGSSEYSPTAYRMLGALELHRNNTREALHYFIEAAKLGEEAAQGVCQSMDIDWNQY